MKSACAHLVAEHAVRMAFRFALVAAYCVSPFGAAERAWKPFNPILGETFELEIGNGVRYLAEQVRWRGSLALLWLWAAGA